DDEERRCDEDRLRPEHRQRDVVLVVEEAAISAAKRDRSVLEEEPQTNIEVRRGILDQTWRPAADVLGVQELRNKFDVTADRDSYADVKLQLVGQVQQFHVVLARVSRVNVADVFVEPEPLALALLTKHQDRSVFKLSTRSAAGPRLIVVRNRYLQVAANRHAEKVLVGVYQIELGADVDVSAAVGRLSRSENRASQTVKAHEIHFPEERKVGVKRGQGRLNQRAEADNLRPIRISGRRKHAGREIYGLPKPAERRKYAAGKRTGPGEEGSTSILAACQRAQSSEWVSEDPRDVVLITTQEERLARSGIGPRHPVNPQLPPVCDADGEVERDLVYVYVPRVSIKVVPEQREVELSLAESSR